jgi:hypothetical protein
VQPDAAEEHVLVVGDTDDDDAMIEGSEQNARAVPIVDLRRSNTG